MALEHRTSVTTTIDPNGYILLQFLTEIWNDNIRIKDGTVWVTTIAPGDEIPETFDVPGVGNIPSPSELRRYAAAAHTPERIAKHQSRPPAPVIPQPTRV
jgi:hypothetical protein